MIYYIFKTQIFTIFLSFNHLTLITFPGFIHDYVGGQAGDFNILLRNKNKTLVYETKRNNFSRNFAVFLKDDRFHFNLKYSNSFSNKDITIKKAEKCSSFKLLISKPNYQILECPRSLYFINKSSVPIKVNEETVVSKLFISKGPPVYVNNTLVYREGRVL
ncbi:MAG: hypothetical protein ACPGJV_12945 [Bacteriovoracaceae bacterium]